MLWAVSVTFVLSLYGVVYLVTFLTSHTNPKMVKVLFIRMCRLGLFLLNHVLELRHLKSLESLVFD